MKMLLMSVCTLLAAPNNLPDNNAHPRAQIACPNWINDGNAVAPAGVRVSPAQARTNRLRCYCSIVKPLVYVGGVPTAEIFAEAYLSIGVNTYSSAVFNFVPDMAVTFYRELRNGNKEVVKRITQEFFIPFIDLRDNCKGYAVSLIKEGADIIGKPAGSVRSPLVMPTPEERRKLEQLIAIANQL